MKLFVFEHLCGGGMRGEPIPPELCEQGRAMLTTVAEDMAALGLDVFTLGDPRVALPVTGVEVRSITNVDWDFDTAVRDADQVLIIAPECDNLLVDWLARVEAIGKPTLNCSIETSRMFGDKWATFKHMIRAGIPTPRTWLIDDAAAALAEHGELLIKPRYGAGCEETRVVRDASQLPAGDGWIAQPYGRGVAASCHAIGSHILPAGLQHVTANDELRYEGGTVPLDESLQHRARQLTQGVVQGAPGINGYVGVDLILGERPEDDVVIEINPRLSMSYIGLSALCQGNLAAAFFDTDVSLHWDTAPVTFDTAGRIAVKSQP